MEAFELCRPKLHNDVIELTRMKSRGGVWSPTRIDPLDTRPTPERRKSKADTEDEGCDTPRKNTAIPKQNPFNTAHATPICTGLLCDKDKPRHRTSKAESPSPRPANLPVDMATLVRTKSNTTKEGARCEALLKHGVAPTKDISRTQSTSPDLAKLASVKDDANPADAKGTSDTPRRRMLRRQAVHPSCPMSSKGTTVPGLPSPQAKIGKPARTEPRGSRTVPECALFEVKELRPKRAELRGEIVAPGGPTRHKENALDKWPKSTTANSNPACPKLRDETTEPKQDADKKKVFAPRAVRLHNGTTTPNSTRPMTEG